MASLARPMRQQAASQAGKAHSDINTPSADLIGRFTIMEVDEL
jgi:hypothetical protein